MIQYLAMQTKFEALVKALRKRIAEQKRRLLAESRRITTGDNVSLQKVAQARETEMRDWQALNRRLNQVPYVNIRQHTSAYVSISQQTSAYVSICQHAILALYRRINQVPREASERRKNKCYY